MDKTFIISRSNFSRFQRLGRELLWVGLGQFMTALGVIVGIRLLTEVLPPNIYGEVALGMTIVMLFIQVLLSPIAKASSRFFNPAQEVKQLPALLHGIRKMLIYVTVLLLVITNVGFFLGLLIYGYSQWLWLVLAAFIFALLSGYNLILDGIQNAARQRLIVAWHQGLASWLRFLSAVGLIGIIGSFSYVAMCGYVLASLVVLGSQLWFFNRKIMVLSFDKSTVIASDIKNWNKRMFSYAWPIATWSIFIWAQVASERWVLQIFTSTHEVGLYTVLYQLGYYPIPLLSGIMLQFVLPILFKRAGDGSDQARIEHTHVLISRIAVVGICITFTGILISFWLHELIFSLLVAPEYRTVSYLLPLMVLSSGFFSVGEIISQKMMTSNKTRDLIVPKIAIALLGIVLNFMGAKWFGLIGVVGASVCLSFLYFVWIILLARMRSQCSS
ncbi:lipopolysaccharide biosynthesis protein [Candidatus Marithrix sp. Canyon 246]|uniref:lipopolysaccharide biosynthesis protein n=1 Tax=Candidatus Marithrix sp. Canyon 246 TaxID=1827136 RepID=UPI00084A18F0|nr:oligosaccharide flippase family protein [Candidatus Marithrix sp. Canyon 246]